MQRRLFGDCKEACAKRRRGAVLRSIERNFTLMASHCLPFGLYARRLFTFLPDLGGMISAKLGGEGSGGAGTGFSRSGSEEKR